MEKILSNIYQLIPYPYIDDKNVLHNGASYTIPKDCQQCSKLCHKDSSDEKIRLCKKGYNYYKTKLFKNDITIFGIFINGRKVKLPRKKKKRLEIQSVEEKQFFKWFETTSDLINNITEFKDQKVKDNFDLFHDINPTISLVFRTLEMLINKVEGNSFEEKVENADFHLKTLYHAIDLLDNRLKIMPLIGNPESAKFGMVTKCSPYKVFDKVKRLFSPSANKKGVSIEISTNKYITFEIDSYDSFITIPFLLIENAIKYSLKSKKIEIHFIQKKSELEIEVTSFGPVVEEENVLKIFEKGFKDDNAKKFSSKGSGIGLYLVDVVAKVHNIEINYDSNVAYTNENGIIVGENIFSLILKSKN